MKTKGTFKNLLLAATFMFSVTAMNAQTAIEKATNYDQGFRLGFGLSGGYMLNPSNTAFGGAADTFSGPAVGGDVRLQYDLSKRLSITLTTGYSHFFIDKDLKNSPLNLHDVGLIPVKAGFKAFFWEDSFYALGEAGAGFTVSKNSPFADNTTVILSPGIGWANKYVDLSLRYEHYTEFETGQVALRLAYGFKL